MNDPIPVPERNRGRRVLLALALLFLGTFFLAGVLRFSAGARTD